MYVGYLIGEWHIGEELKGGRPRGLRKCGAHERIAVVQILNATRECVGHGGGGGGRAIEQSE